ncbi:MAG: hypothetical protein U9Q94_02300 [Candidatus Bipolaricaulota bacterium]|nr:hypothetical protein [Candidatus Bipolaricaulota bacterium]
MTTYQILTAMAALGGLVIGLGGLIIALVSFSRTRKLDTQQSSLQSKQVELTDLQLKLIRKQAAAADKTAGESSADVRVSLEGFSPKYRFVITNWGEREARDVHFELESPPGRESPLVRGDYDEKIPIPVLAPGTQCTLLFDAKWSWRNLDGSEEHRESRLTLP